MLQALWAIHLIRVNQRLELRLGLTSKRWVVSIALFISTIEGS